MVLGASSRLFCAVLIDCFVCASSLSFANDSAASVAAGGVRLTRQAQISMEKERLTISLKKVTVEYEFLNESDQDITTEVAFPVPPFELDLESAGGMRTFNDFHLWVDGRELKYETETKAMLNGKDYSGALHRLGIDIDSFGHADDAENGFVAPDIQKLAPESREVLRRAGLIDGDGRGLWKVQNTYHWTQKFPAHTVLHVRHEYEPGYGFRGADVQDFDPVVRAKKLAEAKAEPGAGETKRRSAKADIRQSVLGRTD
jgi:hypothetical protein